MDDSSIEALREVLQDMTSAIELISSGERSGEALINFVEEMLKTIEAWAAKYNVILDEGVVQSSHPIPVTNASEGKECPLELGQPANQRREHKQVDGEACHQYVENLNQYGGGNAEKAGVQSVRFQNDENERDEKQVANRSKAKPSRRVSRKTRSQVASTAPDGGPMHAEGTSTTAVEGKVHSDEPFIESPKLVDSTSPSQASERKGDVVKSPDWLPNGWVTEIKTRGVGGSAGFKDKYYFDPTSNRRFGSKKEVLAFLGTTKRARGRPKKSESLAKLAQPMDESPRNENDAAQAESIQAQESVMSFNPAQQAPSNASILNDTTIPASTSMIVISPEAVNSIIPPVDATKRKRGRPRKNISVKNVCQTKNRSPGHENAAAEAGTVLELVISSTTELQVPSSTTTDMPPPVNASNTAATSGPLNSCTPMVHQLGQTSEWSVYESLASLPFPMFEHLRLVESNASKLANNNNSPSLWPWMLGNAEGLKKPFVDSNSDGSKPVEEGKQEQNAPISSTGETHAAEVVPKRPKKAARKNAS